MKQDANKKPIFNLPLQKNEQSLNEHTPKSSTAEHSPTSNFGLLIYILETYYEKEDTTETYLIQEGSTIIF